MRWLSYQVATALGWEIRGELPDEPKMVIIGAPHTSNWDFFLFLAALHHLDFSARFLGKSSLFKWPLGSMFRKVGGVPVDRSGPAGMVGQVKAAFEAEDEMILVIAPEGTRSAAPRWKSGFVEIAESAGIPVVLAGVDGANRVVTIGPALRVGEDRKAFMDRVRAFYADQPGINPAGKGPVTLAEESSVS